jgi:hypothetical protein
MKRAALAVVVLAALSAQAQDGFFHGATKAGEACSFSVSWGRGLLNNIAISTPSPASCQPEMRAAADAFSKTPPAAVVERGPGARPGIAGWQLRDDAGMERWISGGGHADVLHARRRPQRDRGADTAGLRG